MYRCYRSRCLAVVIGLLSLQQSSSPKVQGSRAEERSHQRLRPRGAVAAGLQESRSVWQGLKGRILGVRVSVYLYLCVSTHVHIYIYIFADVYVHKCLYRCVHVCMYVSIYLSMYLSIYLSIYLFLNTHKYAYFYELTKVCAGLTGHLMWPG